MSQSYRNKALSVGVIWGLFSGVEGLVPGNPLSWPRIVGRELFYSLGVPAFPPSYFFLLGLAVWSLVFFTAGVILERFLVRQRKVASKRVRLKGGSLR